MRTGMAGFGVVLLIFAAGCVIGGSDHLTSRQIQAIKAEVKATADALTAKTERLDMEGFFAYCQDSPDWTSYGPDGSRADFQTAKTMAIEGYKYLAGHKLTTAREDISVLSLDVAVWGWTGRVEDVFRTGEKAVSDPLAVTLVFKKIAGQWKVVWWHNSCNPPVVEKAADK